MTKDKELIDDAIDNLSNDYDTDKLCRDEFKKEIWKVINKALSSANKKIEELKEQNKILLKKLGLPRDLRILRLNKCKTCGGTGKIDCDIPYTNKIKTVDCPNCKEQQFKKKVDEEEIEKLRKEIMISGGDALMKIQEKVGLKQQLKSQSDEMIMGIDEELKRCRDKKHLNMYDKKYRVYVGGLTEAKNIIRRLKQTHKEQ